MRNRYDYAIDDDGFYAVIDDRDRVIMSGIPTKAEARQRVGHLTRNAFRKARKQLREHHVQDLTELFA